MRKMLLSLCVLFLMFSFSVFGQVSNLLVGGVASNFSAASGGTFGWSYDVPAAGDTTFLQIWIDTDANGQLNSSVDVLWTEFIQIDGDSVGLNGPPDIDGKKDGHVSFQQKLGLASAHYILYFKNRGVIKLVAGQITALASPTFTISGKVTNNSTGVANIVVNLGAKNGMAFWTGITDASGNYSIKMDSDTSGNPWRLKIDNSFIFRPDIFAPDRIELTLDKGVKTSYTGNDFTESTASASISGTLKDDNGNPTVNGVVFINSNDGSFSRATTTDSAGVFKLGLLASELPKSNLNLNSGEFGDTNIVVAQHTFSSVQAGNQLTQDLQVFKTNSTITGRVTVNNSAPGFIIEVFAQNSDTGFSQTFTDMQGYYRAKVSTKIYNYTIALGSGAKGYNYTNPIAHAGDINVNINLVPTDVKLIDSNIPAEYSLSQNYPNPFNPNTIINYDISKPSHVTLTIYNMLGQEITKLVDKQQTAGRYSADFNAANLASGIYFYRIQAGDFVSARKMILMK